MAKILTAHLTRLVRTDFVRRILAEQYCSLREAHYLRLRLRMAASSSERELRLESLRYVIAASAL